MVEPAAGTGGDRTVPFHAALFRTVRFNGALYERAAVERVARDLEPYADVEVVPAETGCEQIPGEQPSEHPSAPAAEHIVVKVRPKGEHSPRDVVGELCNHVLVASVELRREGRRA